MSASPPTSPGRLQRTPAFRRRPAIGPWMILLAMGFVSPSLAALEVDKLRCEYLDEPLGIHQTTPRLSWTLDSTERDQQQTAYRILVASDPALLDSDQGDLWDTGKIESSATHQIVYQGLPLDSRDRCFWKIRAWDRDDEPSAWSDAASWSMGLLDPADWSAEWIDGARSSIAPGDIPEILEASYEAVDGAGSLDVTSQVAAFAGTDPGVLPVSNASLGGDPAYGHIKQLRIEYRHGGSSQSATIPEGGQLHYPQDLPRPAAVLIVSATYEAIDGAGSADVTGLLADLADDGGFDLPVSNDALGGDPAPNHFKRLRISYEIDGQAGETEIPESGTLRFPHDLIHPPSIPYLRKGFETAGPISRATLHVTALGLYELSLNGERVGDHMLAPDWTDYAKRVRHQTYDVTPLLNEGANAIGAQVAPGWYAGRIGNGGHHYWGATPALLAQLEIEYVDGSSETIATDASWKLHPSGLASSDIMLGEHHDARRDVPGWHEPGFDDSGWAPAIIREENGFEISGQVTEPVRELTTLPAVALTEPEPGRWVFDLGQNMVGVVRLKIGASAGTRLTLRHAEMLNPDGTIYTENLRGAASIDRYICRGDLEEIWQPKFTFHGFRYVEVTGLSEEPPLDLVTGVVLASDTPVTGSFACSDPRVNQLQSNIEWGQRGNFLSVPTDCPQRDERLGWMGDAQVFVRTASFNADVAAFFSKWMVDVIDAQRGDGAFTDVVPFVGFSAGSPGWGDAGVICPWMIYQAYGDRRILESCYPAMKAWVEWCRGESTDSIRDGARGYDYGDWLSINADTDKELIGTAYYARSADLLSRSATVLGMTGDAATYAALFETIRQAFTDRYVTADGRVGNNTQTALALALEFDLLPEELRDEAAQWLVDDIEAKGDHLSTGFLGVGHLLPALTASDRTDVAYRLLEQDTFPSWLFPVANGATTVWERWDGWTPDNGFQNPGMNSFNHYSLGSCGEWLFSTVAGIDRDLPGFERILIHPRPGGNITSASASLDSIRGPIESRWTKSPDGFSLDVTIPANTTADVHVPATSVGEVFESGIPATAAEGVQFLEMVVGAARFRVGSGRYRFTTGAELPGTDALHYDAGAPRRIRIATLLENDGDEAPTFLAADPLSLRGETIAIDGDWLVYSSAAGQTGGDSFGYTVRNADGGVTHHTVLLSPFPADSPPQEAESITIQPDDSARVRFRGVPGRIYRVEFTDSLGQAGSWEEMEAIHAAEDGSFEIVDPAPLPDQRFYRAVHP